MLCAETWVGWSMGLIREGEGKKVGKRTFQIWFWYIYQRLNWQDLDIDWMRGMREGRPVCEGQWMPGWVWPFSCPCWWQRVGAVMMARCKVWFAKLTPAADRVVKGKVEAKKSLGGQYNYERKRERQWPVERFVMEKSPMTGRGGWGELSDLHLQEVQEGLVAASLREHIWTWLPIGSEGEKERERAKISVSKVCFPRAWMTDEAISSGKKRGWFSTRNNKLDFVYMPEFGRPEHDFQ